MYKYGIGILPVYCPTDLHIYMCVREPARVWVRVCASACTRVCARVYMCYNELLSVGQIQLPCPTHLPTCHVPRATPPKGPKRSREVDAQPLGHRTRHRPFRSHDGDVSSGHDRQLVGRGYGESAEGGHVSCVAADGRGAW